MDMFTHSQNHLSGDNLELAHGKGYLFFKPETSSPPVADGSTEFGGRRTRWECAMQMMLIWKAQRAPRPLCPADSSAAVLNT